MGSQTDRGGPDTCPHCSPWHDDPNSKSWGVFVSSDRDGDGQPTHLYVSPSNGAHVAESDAVWLRKAIDHYTPKEAPVRSWSEFL